MVSTRTPSPVSSPPLSVRVTKHAVASFKGKIFIGFVSACAAGSVVWYVLRGRAAKGKKKKRKPRTALKRAIKLALRGSRKAYAIAFAVPIGVGASIYISRQVNTEFGALASQVMRRDWESTFESLYKIGILTLPMVSIEALRGHMQNMLALEMRENLESTLRTTYLKLDYNGKVETSDAMASLAIDTKNFSTDAADFYCNVMNASVQIFSRPILLGMHMGWKDFMVLITYESFMRGAILRRVLPSLDGLAKDAADSEATLGVASQQVASHAAEINIMGGGAYEKQILSSLSQECYAKSENLSSSGILPETLRGYLGSKLGQVFAFLTMLPAVYYATDTSTTRTGEDPLMYLTNAVHDLIDLGKSIGLLFRQLGGVDKLSGLASRVTTIQNVKDANACEKKETSSDELLSHTYGATAEEKGDILKVKDVDVMRFGDKSDEDDDVDAKKSQLLLKNINFSLKAGERLLIRGANGIGKTTLIRLISGRFAFKGSRGCVELPPESDCFFLPATNYFPPHSNLKNQLAYPKTSDDFTIEEMQEALKKFGLGNLGIALLTPSPFDPALTLSSGEQRKLCLARVWLHKPKLAFLDEPLASIRGIEEYRILLKRIPTVVTISHIWDSSFRALHSHYLELKEGAAKLTKKAKRAEIP